MRRVVPFILFFLLFMMCDKNSTGSDEKTYRIEYNGNGHTSGTGPIDGNTYKNGDSATVLSQGTLIKNSHIFSGWNTNADGTGMMYSSGSKLIIGESNITLYAQWVQLTPPINFKATAGNQQNTITFTPVTGATTYNLYWGTTTPVSKSFTKIELTNTIYTHTSLNNGTKYYYAISSANNSTESNLSQEANATPFQSVTPPQPPTNVKATAGNGQNTITFTPAAGATKYNLYWGTTTPVTKSFAKIELGSNNYTHSNLTNGTKYYYAISSVNNLGEGNLSQQVDATPFQSVNPPLPPTNVKAIAGNKQNTIIFNASVGATSYKLYWDTKPISKTTAKWIDTITSPYIHTPLVNGTKYYYAIVAINAIGESNLSQEVNSTPFQSVTPPQPPSNVQATARNKQNIVAFTASVGATFYTLYWDTKPIDKATAKTIDSITAPFVHDSLTNGTKYYYALTAINSIGESELSIEVSATPTEIIQQQGMVLISTKGKSFMMGNANGKDDEKPVHKVTFSYDFYMDSTEVSQASYKAILGVNPSVFKGDNLPVENCSWYDAVLYCNARSKQKGKDTVYTYTAIIGTAGNGSQLRDVNIDYSKNGYRLPTEAEWEYAYRAGSTTAYYWGDQIDGDYCWYKDNSDSTTHPVGTKKPNSFGLYNMGGNVIEACNDWYGKYFDTDITNPIGVDSGDYRVYRGGSWPNSAINYAYRWLIEPTWKSNGLGFRTVLGNFKKENLQPPMNIEIKAGDKKNTLTFSASLGALSYNLYWDTKPVEKATAKKVNIISTSYSHTSLVNGTKYYYAISSVNNSGESPLSKEVNATPIQILTPPIPTQLLAIPDDKKNTITFTASTGATSYKLYWDTIPINKSTAKTVNISSTKFIHAPLVNGTKYYYAVASINSFGESDLSLEVNAVPKKLLEMVLIPAQGKSFMMGNNNSDADEKPVHKVTFTYNFYLGTTEVTQADYQTLLGVNPSHFKATYLPVEKCTWYDAVLYCNARSKKEGIDTVYSYTEVIGTPGEFCELRGLSIDLTKDGYRLPTEAEWEYACRAGSTTNYYWGDKMDDDYCWYSNNSSRQSHPIATKRPNSYGLYDMSGNVYEWCNDLFGDYSSEDITDPTGADSGRLRVLRGGGWYISDDGCRSSTRYKSIPDYISNNFGFRIARGIIK